MSSERQCWTVLCLAVAIALTATAWGALEETIDFGKMGDLAVGDVRASMRRLSSSSGFFVTGSGYVVTDRHRIAGATLLVVVHDNVAYEARRVPLPAAAAGIALLKVDGRLSLPCAVVPQGSSCKAGDTVTAGGFAVSDEYGLSAQFVRGVVSGVKKREYEVFFTVLPEQSGGIVVDRRGQCAGMLLGVGGKKRSVNRVLNWKTVYADLPIPARTHLLFEGGRAGTRPCHAQANAESAANAASAARDRDRVPLTALGDRPPGDVESVNGAASKNGQTSGGCALDEKKKTDIMLSFESKCNFPRRSYGCLEDAWCRRDGDCRRRLGEGRGTARRCVERDGDPVLRRASRAVVSP